LARATIALEAYDKAREHLIRAFSRTIASNEQGIILVALAVMARYLAATGDLKTAVMLAILVQQHHGSWRETKMQVESVLALKQKLTPEQAAGAEAEAQERQKDVWQLAADMLAALEHNSPR
jgi:hypothetical protein